MVGWWAGAESHVKQDQGDEALGLSRGMMPSWPDGATGSNSASTSQPSCPRYHPYTRRKLPGENVTSLLAWREVSPSVKRPLRRLWGDAASSIATCSGHQHEVIDAKQALISWSEAESLRHCTAKYCDLHPAPRSTIAAAFSPDGNTLASTHGDHTVKITCCRTGDCLKVLSGHRRTPWVVRFHPGSSEVLASGSLDNEVRLWDANTAECVGSHDFHRPIASLAFHAQGDLLAVASGHKLYIWHYTREGDESAPVIVLRTRRSLRAVHFHPHAAPLLLTAEVNDLDSPDCPMTVATSRGYLHYPAPAIHFTAATSAQQSNPPSAISQPFVSFPVWFWPGMAFGNSDGFIQPEVALAENLVAATVDGDVEDAGNGELVVEKDGSLLQPPDFCSAAPMDLSPRPTYVESALATTSRAIELEEDLFPSELIIVEDFPALHAHEEQNLVGDPGRNSPTIVGVPWDVGEPGIPVSSSRTRSANSSQIPVIPVARRQVNTVGCGPASGIWPITTFPNMNTLGLPQGTGPQFLPAGDFSGWELPFIHGWVQGQAQAGFSQPSSGAVQIRSSSSIARQTEARGAQQQQTNASISVASVAMAAAMAAARAAARAGAGMSGATSAQISAGAAIGAAAGVGLGMRMTANQGIPGRGGSSVGAAEAAAAQATMVAAAAAAELPCTVKLRIWPHDIKHPSALLDPGTCRLTIPHAVLCSEMGAHFSPCGRFLAACVACVLPTNELETQGQRQRTMNGSPGTGSAVHSPTQHPISAQQVIYELRVYSLEEATFGQVLASRAVRAAHCLTSIQFSPTSGHILLAYGRRHNSLLRSLVVDGCQTIPIYTILEVYRVSDMELVRVLPSAEDEVNVACFHPRAGGGLVYGTKEGKLRILRHDRTPRHLNPRGGQELEDELLEAETTDPMSFGMVPDMDDPL